MTDLMALQAVFWFSVGFCGVAWSFKLSDWLVARYHRRLKEADKN